MMRLIAAILEDLRPACLLRLKTTYKSTATHRAKETSPDLVPILLTSNILAFVLQFSNVHEGPILHLALRKPLWP